MPHSSDRSGSAGAPFTEDYVLITVAKQNFTWEARILSRGMPHLSVKASLPNRLKTNTRVTVGAVCLVDMRDADNGEGTADILEVLDTKDIRKLRHKGIIPEEDEYSYLLVSDKRLGYTGGAFPYKAKLTGLGPSTLPEDADVIARARYLERVARREARKAENGGISTATTPSTSPQMTPGAAAAAATPAEDGSALPAMELPASTGDGSAATVQPAGAAAAAAGSSSSDEDEESDADDDEEEEEGEETAPVEEDLENVVNPNRANDKWVTHGDQGVSKGYVSKRERRDLELQERMRKRAAPPPRQSPSLIPQMAALDRVGGDAELSEI